MSTSTENLETGPHFKHNIQRRVSYKSFVESKWWDSYVSKKFLFPYDIYFYCLQQMLKLCSSEQIHLSNFEKVQISYLTFIIGTLTT
jgi:hypothetical protein